MTTAVIELKRPDDERRSKAMHGLSRTLVNNLVVGVTAGYEKKLEIHGVGYRVALKGSTLEFALGFSHPVVIPAPEGITFAVETPTRFSVSGIDKQLVGETAANIRKLRKPDPYKGKGVRYAGEVIRRKVGKTGRVMPKTQEGDARASVRGCSGDRRTRAVRAGTPGCARRSTAAPSARGWRSSAARGTSWCSSSTTCPGTRWPRRPRWRPTCGRWTATRRRARPRSASWSRPGPGRPG